MSLSSHHYVNHFIFCIQNHVFSKIFIFSIYKLGLIAIFSYVGISKAMWTSEFEVVVSKFLGYERPIITLQIPHYQGITTLAISFFAWKITFFRKSSFSAYIRAYSHFLICGYKQGHVDKRIRGCRL